MHWCFCGMAGLFLGAVKVKRYEPETRNLTVYFLTQAELFIDKRHHDLKENRHIERGVVCHLLAVRKVNVPLRFSIYIKWDS